MEKSQCTIQLGIDKGPPVLLKNSCETVHTWRTPPLEKAGGGIMKPIKNGNYPRPDRLEKDDGVVLPGFGLHEEQWSDKTYVSTLDVSVVDQRETALEEYVTTFPLPTLLRNQPPPEANNNHGGRKLGSLNFKNKNNLQGCSTYLDINSGPVACDNVLDIRNRSKPSSFFLDIQRQVDGVTEVLGKNQSLNQGSLHIGENNSEVNGRNNLSDRCQSSNPRSFDLLTNNPEVNRRNNLSNRSQSSNLTSSYSDTNTRPDGQCTLSDINGSVNSSWAHAEVNREVDGQCEVSNFNCTVNSGSAYLGFNPEEDDLDYNEADISHCSCCSEELFMDDKVNRNTPARPDKNHIKESVTQPIKYLNKTSSKENTTLYSFGSKSEWGERAHPLTEWTSSPRTQLDYKPTEEKSVVTNSQDRSVAKKDERIDQSNKYISETTTNMVEKVSNKWSDNLYVKNRLKSLSIKSTTKENNVKDHDRPGVQPKCQNPESVKFGSQTKPVPSEGGKGVTAVMEPLRGKNRKLGICHNAMGNTIHVKPPPTIVVTGSSRVNTSQSHGLTNARIPEYHQNKFVLDITRTAAPKQKKLTKHLSLQINADEALPHKESGPNRILHKPIAKNILIPIVLEEPIPPGQEVISPQSRKNSDTDLEELKEMAKKLNLSTRRPSYMLWKERLHHHELSVSQAEEEESEQTEATVTDLQGFQNHTSPQRQKPMSFRVNAVNQALAWLKRELGEMRSQDQALARSLIQIRQEIKELKLQRSCAEHQEILEDARDLEDEKDIMGELSCEYIHESFSPTLKQVGVTRMNIGTRRFSVF